MKPPVRVAVTGAAGQISYALLFRIAAGDMLGPDQPIILQLLEIPPAMEALEGVFMELADCAFPLLTDIVRSSDPDEAFSDVDYALLVGARPRGPGMERKDLLLENAKIFSAQGKALNDHASRAVRVLVVGNPANTNALIASANAPDIPSRQFSAMMRLDHHRAVAQLADHLGVSTAAAAAAAIAHVRTWVFGTPVDDWTSMGGISDGSYGIGEGIYYSFPVTCSNGEYQIVEGLEISRFSRMRMDATQAELEEERNGVCELL